MSVTKLAYLHARYRAGMLSRLHTARLLELAPKGLLSPGQRWGLKRGINAYMPTSAECLRRFDEAQKRKKRAAEGRKKIRERPKKKPIKRVERPKKRRDPDPRHRPRCWLPTNPELRDCATPTIQALTQLGIKDTFEEYKAYFRGGFRVLIALLVMTVTIPAAPDQWHEVWATREGLIGHVTASGLKIEADDVFVALPSRKALGRRVEVTLVYASRRAKGRLIPPGRPGKGPGPVITCKVEDVGPWSTRDPYWETGTRPLAESGKRKPWTSPARNPAGIDLSDGLWKALGISRKRGLVRVKWRFVE